MGQDIGKALSEEIFNRISAESMQLFDVLNPLSWPADQKYPFSGFVQYRDDDLVKLYRMVFASDSFDMRVDDDTLIKDWREMLGALTTMPIGARCLGQMIWLFCGSIICIQIKYYLL